MKLKELQEKREKLSDELENIKSSAEQENRAFTDDERSNIDSKLSEIEQVDADITRQRKLEGVSVKSDSTHQEDTRDVENTNIDVPEKDKRRYSLVKAIRQQVEGTGLDGIEKELSDEVAKQRGQDPNGFYVPYQAIDTRDVTTSTGSGAIGTDFRPDEFISLLRNATHVRSLGATVLEGLQGDVQIPRQDSSATAAWETENTQADEDNLTIGQVDLKPKTLTGYTQVSKKLIRQSAMSVEQMVRQDLARLVAIKLDDTVYNGASGGADPEGLISKLTVVNEGSNVSYDQVVQTIANVKSNNGDQGSLAFVTNADGWEQMVQEPRYKDVDYGVLGGFVADPESGTVLGRQFRVTEQLASDHGTGNDEFPLIYGDWSDVLIGLFGALDIVVDPFSSARNGLVNMTVQQEADINFRHTESFAYSTFTF